MSVRLQRIMHDAKNAFEELFQFITEEALFSQLMN